MSDLPQALDSLSDSSGQEPNSVDDFSNMISPDHGKSLKADRKEWKPSPSNLLDYYGFTEHPFSDSVNPHFFYGSSVHETAFRKMAMTIEEDISLGLVHGVSGTGKTLLTQMLLTHLKTEDHQIALIMVSPGMSKTSLLKEILREVLAEGDALPAQTQSLLDLLHSHIIDLYRQNKKLVILIDEAHFLSAESLHILRTISNLETPQKKLATTILFAEDLFLRRLSHPSYQSLRNRMYMKVPLVPMGPDETIQYIKFRLLGSGCTDPLFDEEAYAEIHKASGGICRDINRICFNSLSEAYLKGERRIGRDLVQKAIA